MADTERLRRALEEFHAANTRAQSATFGSEAFADAMRTLRTLREELRAAGVDPMKSWREPTQRALGLPVKRH